MNNMEVNEVNEVIATLEVIDDTLAAMSAAELMSLTPTTSLTPLNSNRSYGK